MANVVVERNTSENRTRTARRVVSATVIVSALGYFVDVYDLLLFSIVRQPSLAGLGVAAADQLSVGVTLLNWQMIGLLSGGILWGVLGDKRGRVSVLFGSIALYSLANIANAFVVSVPQYATLRFLAGVGLAGELGAAVTLVSEVMAKDARGYGTAIVAGVGIFGAVVAALVGRLFDWRVAFVVGGVLGLGLLVLRFRLAESGMFADVSKGAAKRGSLRMLLGSRARVVKYLACILVGLPLWFAIGVLVTFSPEFGASLGATGPIVAGSAVMWCYVGASVGGLATGVLSEWLKSRKWVLFGSICYVAATFLVYLFAHNLAPWAFYGVCLAMGLGVGYWSVFVTNGAEQFGTNLRATVATTVPNLVRGTTVPLTLLVTFLRPSQGLVQAALIVGVGTILVALASLKPLAETYGKDLAYVES